MPRCGVRDRSVLWDLRDRSAAVRPRSVLAAFPGAGSHALGLGRRAREVADGGLMGYGPDDRPLVMLVSLLVARGAGALGVSSHHAIALARRAVLLTLGALCVVAALNAQGLELRFLDVGQGTRCSCAKAGRPP